MKRANKHAVSKINFSPLTGGINVSVPPEQLAANEMQICKNFIYDSAKLIGRGGLKKIKTDKQFGSSIKHIFYDYDSNTAFAFLDNLECYQIILGNETAQVKKIGDLTGNEKPSCVRFQNKLFIASGGLLQYCDFSEMTNDKGEAVTKPIATITTSNICNRLFYRWGRLACCRTGSDYIYYSSVGDAIGNDSFNAWEENTTDDSTARFLEVGYADSGDIVEVIPLATDIIVFKSNGKAYQIIGDNDFGSVSIVNVSSFTDVTKDFKQGVCGCNIGNEVVFLSLRGLRTLSAVQDYGNIATSDIGNKFNNLLTDKLYEPEMYNLSRHKMLIIRPTSSLRYFVAYNYNLGVATTLEFGVDVTSICETRNDILVCSDNGIYRVTEEETNDNAEKINYNVSPRDISSNDEILIKAIDTKFLADYSGKTTVKIGERLSVDMPTNNRRKVHCNHSTNLIHLELSSNDRFCIDHISLDVADL